MKNILQICFTIKRKHMADTVKKIKLSEEDVSNVFRLPPDERRKAQTNIVENLGIKVYPGETPFMTYIRFLQKKLGFPKSNDIEPKLWFTIDNDPDAKRR